MTKAKSTTEARRHGERSGDRVIARDRVIGRTKTDSEWLRHVIVTRISCVIPSALKTSISIPRSSFRRAEAAARKLKKPRSQLYATALAEYLERRKTSKVTERLNEVYSTEPSKLDRALESAQIKSLVRESW